MLRITSYNVCYTKLLRVYHNGWMASAFGPRAPWVAGMPDISKWQPDKDRWELYDLAKDWSQADDLATKMPEKLASLKDLFLIELRNNFV